MPELTKRFPFVRLDPAELRAAGVEFETAATVAGLPRLTASRSQFEEMETLDFVVVGCVAVTRSGGRTGKGGGFADLELGIFRELGKVGPGHADRHHGPFEPGGRRCAPADDGARLGARTSSPPRAS